MQEDSAANNSQAADSKAVKIVDQLPAKEQAIAAKKTTEAVDDRETWGRKADFMLSVIGFAVDLGNVWRFPFVCYRNGGGAFLIPYVVMLVFGGLPLFYMELALGQYQKCGCISVWKRICPMFKGIGFGIFFIASFVAMYYNTIIAWSLYFLFASFSSEVPWASCGNDWNTDDCVSLAEVNGTGTVSSAKEYFDRSVLEVHKARGLDDVGPVKWSIALCLLLVFAIVYFSLWKGIKSSGKAVWITATLPYVILFILLGRGLTLPGSLDGILFYLTPKFERLLDEGVWIDAAAQIFFSLGPGFGVLLALSSYNKLHSNCHADALVTSIVNCATSFLSGFVVFSVLGYMAHKQQTTIENVAEHDVGLVFVVYPEAIATLTGSVFWAIIFFLMLITLGLDSTFGGLEALITGVCDEWPAIKKKRELFVLVVVVYCFLGALSTATYGGNYVINLLDAHGAPISILFICFLEVTAVSWFYGVNRFASDIEEMVGHRPGVFWRLCWAVISPLFLIALFLLSILKYRPLSVDGYVYPDWATGIGWLITGSSIVCVPIYIVYRLMTAIGLFFGSNGQQGQRRPLLVHRIQSIVWYMIRPEEVPVHRRQGTVPVPVLV